MVTKVVVRDPAIAESLIAKGYKLIGKKTSGGRTEFQFPDSRELCAEVFNEFEAEPQLRKTRHRCPDSRGTPLGAHRHALAC